MRRIILFVSLLAAVGVTPAHAAASCEVTATGYPGSRGDCSYVASGPGTYTVETLSGFIISASNDGGAHYRTLVSHIGNARDPSSGVAAVYSGTLDTKSGDIVVAAIALDDYRSPAGVLTFQDGHLTAGDA